MISYQMGQFFQKGLCYSFESLQGFLSHKNIRIPMKEKKSGTPPPSPLKKAGFWRTKAKMGCFSQMGFCYSFVILQGLLSNRNIRIPMGKKIRGPPLPTGQKPKWAVSPRRVCATVLEICMGS